MTTINRSSTRRRTQIVGATVLLFCAASAGAQTIDAIAGGGYERARLDGDFTGIRNYSWFDEPATGDVGTAAAGVRMSFDSQFGVIARGAVSRLKTEFSDELPDALVLLPGPTPTILTQSVVRRFPLTLTSYELEALGTWSPVPWAGIGIGGAVGYRTASDFESTQHLEGVPNARFNNPDSLPTRDDGRTIVLDTGSLATNALSAAALVSILGDVPLGGSISLVPEVRVRYDLTSPFEGAGWQRIGVAGMLSVRVTLAGREDDPMGIEMPNDGISPTVRLFAIAEDGARLDRLPVRPTEYEVSRTTPILPFLSVASDAQRLRSPSSPADARAMLDSVLRLDAPAQHEDVIGMVGLILKAHPEGRARLRPRSIDAASLAQLEAQRLEMLSRFDIEPARLTVDRKESKPGSDGSVEDITVGIVVDPPSLASIATRWIERGFASLPLHVDAEVETGDWEVVLERAGETFDTLRGGGRGAHGLRLRIPFGRSASQPPIIARLITDEGVIARDTLEINVTADVVERRRSRFDLPGPRERAGAPIDVDDVAHTIGDSDRVVITGREAAIVGRQLELALGSRAVAIETLDTYPPNAPASPAGRLLSERTSIVVESSDVR
jgi:hypothetical protein